MPTTLQRVPRLSSHDSGPWREPIDFKALGRTICRYAIFALLLFIPILLTCAEIATATHAAKFPFAKAVFRASEESICIELDECGGP